MLVISFGGLSLLVVCGLVVIGAWMLIRGGDGGTGELVEQFEPVAGLPESTSSNQKQSTEIAASPSSDPMIAASQEFIELAAVPNSGDAVAMIDQELFDQRVRSPEGSAEAVQNNISAKKLLSNFHRKSFESTPGNGALRHWKVLGKTRFDGQDAVLVRYYSEVVPPVKWIRSDELLASLIPLISLDQYWEATGILHLLSPSTRGSFSNSVPQRPNANGLFFPRAGYMLLCFDDVDGRTQLSDLASAISRLRLSRAAGELFLRDWDVIKFGPGKGPEVTAKPLTVSIFGELAWGMSNEGRSFDSLGDFRHYVGPSGKPVDNVPALKPDQQANRTFRLAEIGSRVHQASPQLDEKLTAFRRDFPDDLGADMTVVCVTMVKQYFEVEQGTAASITDSAQRIYDRFGDPFMLYVQWMVAKSQDNQAAMNRLLPELKKSGFETAEMHRYQLQLAIQSKDSEGVLGSLADLGRYWDPDGQLQTPELNKQVKQRWGYIADVQSRQSDDLAQNGRRPSAGFGPFGRGPRSPIGDRSRGRSPGEASRSEQAGPPRTPSGRSGPPPGFGPPSRSGRRGRPAIPQWSAAPEDTVVISIDSDKSFDVNGMAKDLITKLGTKIYRASRSNTYGTITLEYSGSLENVKDAIDFGEAEIENEEGRRLRVRLIE